jgi:hypothetical protein
MMADSPGVGGNNSRSTTTYPTNNNSYAGNNPPTAASPQQPQQPVMRGPASTEVVNVGGINLDKEKLRKVIEALKNANKTPQQ